MSEDKKSTLKDLLRVASIFGVKSSAATQAAEAAGIDTDLVDIQKELDDVYGEGARVAVINLMEIAEIAKAYIMEKVPEVEFITVNSNSTAIMLHVKNVNVPFWEMVVIPGLKALAIRWCAKEVTIRCGKWHGSTPSDNFIVKIAWDSKAMTQTGG